jgi:hypothetical protein
VTSGESCLRITNYTKQIRSLREDKTNRSCVVGFQDSRT